MIYVATLSACQVKRLAPTWLNCRDELRVVTDSQPACETVDERGSLGHQVDGSLSRMAILSDHCRLP